MFNQLLIIEKHPADALQRFYVNESWKNSFCRAGSRDFEKGEVGWGWGGVGGVLYVGHYGLPTKKILGFRWSEKAKITLETISFWRNISISIFKFSPFLYTVKAWQWNLILVMNITQTSFLYWQNVHVWLLIKVNYRRRLWLVVVPAKLSGDTKRKFLQMKTIKYKLKLPKST